MQPYKRAPKVHPGFRRGWEWGKNTNEKRNHTEKQQKREWDREKKMKQHTNTQHLHEFLFMVYSETGFWSCIYLYEKHTNTHQMYDKKPTSYRIRQLVPRIFGCVCMCVCMLAHVSVWIAENWKQSNFPGIK